MTKWRSVAPVLEVPRAPRGRPGKVYVGIWRFDHDARALWSVLAYLVWKEVAREPLVPELRPLVTVGEVQGSLERAGRKMSRRAVRRVLKRLERAGIIERHSGGR